MLGRKKIYPDKFLWRIMSDSGMKLNKSYDMAVAYLEGGATYFVHDHVKAKKKFTFLHVDYKICRLQQRTGQGLLPGF